MIFVRHKQDSESTKMKVISLNKYDMQLINDVTIGRVSYLIYVSRRHYVLTTSGDIVVCFRTAVCLSWWFVNFVMAFSICYWANYTQGKTKLSRKSENTVADDRVLKFLYDVDLRHDAS